MLASEVPMPRASSRPRSDRDTNDVDECASVRERLAVVKARVPETQARIGMKRWNSIVNVASSVEHRKRDRTVINRAYHKMHEICMSCVLPNVSSSIHLCEAPGGFVQCVADHLRSASNDWLWRAVTLRDGIAVDEGRLPRDCGQFLFADVVSEETRVVADLRAAFAEGGVDLVTADGAMEMNHDRMEEEHLPLARAQTRIALQCLRPGGIYILKVFECLNPDTCDFISQLTRHFAFVSLMKPTSSRRTNSERYLVCRGLTVSPSSSLTIDDERYVHATAWRDEYNRIVTTMAIDQIQALTRVVESVS